MFLRDRGCSPCLRTARVTSRYPAGLLVEGFVAGKGVRTVLPYVVPLVAPSLSILPASTSTCSPSKPAARKISEV